jgi:hypothetical protein
MKRPPRSLRSLPPETPMRAGRSQGSQSPSARVGAGRRAMFQMTFGSNEAGEGQFLGAALRN